VWSVIPDPGNPGRIVGVRGWDLLVQRERTFKAKTVVLSAGTIESAKIALQSGLADPNGKIGRGMTDHTIRYRHFTLPPGAGQSSLNDSAKVVLRHQQGSAGQHAVDIVVELGAAFNQGLRRCQGSRARTRRAERLDAVRAGFHRVGAAQRRQLDRRDRPAIGPGARHGQPVPAVRRGRGRAGPDRSHPVRGHGSPGGAPRSGLGLQTADLGGVAHQVSTLRTATDGSGVVDANLKFHGYDNPYVCDNSVFPASPAANPSLTLAALALRLANHLRA
jgi:choline dehydrogenase-like flavoprotein